MDYKAHAQAQLNELWVVHLTVLSLEVSWHVNSSIHW